MRETRRGKEEEVLEEETKKKRSEEEVRVEIFWRTQPEVTGPAASYYSLSLLLLHLLYPIHILFLLFSSYY